MSIGALCVGRPRQLDQPVEIRADHRVFAGAFGHALEALQFLARLLLDFLGHLRLGDRLLELRDLRRALVAFAQLLLDRAHLLAQQVLAVGCRRSSSRVRSSISRETFSTSMRCASRSSSLSSRVLRSNVSSSACFSSALMSISPAMKSASRAGPSMACSDDDHLVRHLRQQLQDLDRALLQRAAHAPSMSGSALSAIGDELARGRRGTDSPRGTAARESAARPGRSRDARRPAP